MDAVSTRDWVDYCDGQEEEDIYSSLAYTDLRGVNVEVKAQFPLKPQVDEIYRTNGRKTYIRLYIKEDL